MLFRSINLPKHTPTPGGTLGSAQLTCNGRNIMIKFSELKKGDRIMHSHLGSSPAVSGYIMESPRQGRGVKSTILVDVKGSEVGMFDEIGSIYSNQVMEVERDGSWIRVDQKELNPMICFPNFMLKAHGA